MKRNTHQKVPETCRNTVVNWQERDYNNKTKEKGVQKSERKEHKMIIKIHTLRTNHSFASGDMG